MIAAYLLIGYHFGLIVGAIIFLINIFSLRRQILFFFVLGILRQIWVRVSVWWIWINLFSLVSPKAHDSSERVINLNSDDQYGD